jgi:hypothetical protein
MTQCRHLMRVRTRTGAAEGVKEKKLNIQITVKGMTRTTRMKGVRVEVAGNIGSSCQFLGSVFNLTLHNKY